MPPPLQCPDQEFLQRHTWPWGPSLAEKDAWPTLSKGHLVAPPQVAKRPAEGAAPRKHLPFLFGTGGLTASYWVGRLLGAGLGTGAVLPASAQLDHQDSSDEPGEAGLGVGGLHCPSLAGPGKSSRSEPASSPSVGTTNPVSRPYCCPWCFRPPGGLLSPTPVGLQLPCTGQPPAHR